MRGINVCRLCSAVLLLGALSVYGPELEGFDYPFAVQRYGFTSQRQSLTMAYMDVPAVTPNGRTVVLLHGKNF